VQIKHPEVTAVLGRFCTFAHYVYCSTEATPLDFVSLSFAKASKRDSRNLTSFLRSPCWCQRHPPSTLKKR